MALRVIKLLVLLVVLASVGVLGYSLLGDMSSNAVPQSKSVTLNGG